MRLNVEVYIQGERVELFQDESISINLSVKNFQNIDKVFNDFTQSFTIPASSTNNKILERWYDSNLTISLNPAIQIPARIDLNTLPFREGLISIDKATVKNNKAESYTVTFFGNNRNLSQLFGEDFLTDLDLSTKKLTSALFGSAFAGRVLNDDVFIPLISPNKALVYDVTSNANSIKYASGSVDSGIAHQDAKPAIRLSRILDAIEVKYGITFTSTFFDSADFQNLYMWAHRYADVTLNNAGDFVNQNPTAFSPADPSPFYDTINQWYLYATTDLDATRTYLLTLSDGGNDPDGQMEVILYDKNDSNNVLIRRLYNTLDVFTDEFIVDRPVTNDMHLMFAARSTEPDYMVFDILIGAREFTNLNYLFDSNDFSFSDETITSAVTGEALKLNGNLPQQKTSEFLGGIIQMFNLIIEPISSTEFRIETLDYWLAQEGDLNLTKYIDSSEQTIRPSELYGQINFKYFDTKSILGENFKQNNDGVGYGDVRTFIVDSNGKQITGNEFTVNLPFTNMSWSRINDVTNDNKFTDFLVGAMIDRSLKPIVEKPIIFYYAGQQDVSTTPYGTKATPSASLTSRATYNLCYQFNTKTDSFTGSLNFGSELNPFTLNDGSDSTPSLYNDYWKNYITSLYDLQYRRLTFKAILPINILIGLKLNSDIVIGVNKYRINTMQVDLTTGESTLDLITIV